MTLLLVVLVGWYSFGLASVYGRIWYRQASIPLSIAIGSIADLPEGPSYFDQKLWPTPERDLLAAISRQQHRDPDGAEMRYRSVPQFAEAWNNLGVILKERGRTEEAQRAFERALQIDPGLAEAAWNAGKGARSFWTTLHQQYVPEQPMLAPPTREQMQRAFLGMSSSAMFLRALAGPLVNIRYVRSDSIGTPPPAAATAVFTINDGAPPAIAIVPAGLFIVMLLAIIGLVLPQRDVTQPPPRTFAILEYALPGVSSRWRIAGGIVLMLWSLFVVAAVLRQATGTPFRLAANAVITPRAFGVERSSQQVGALSAMRASSLWAPMVLIFAANAVLVWRWHRERR